MINLTNDGRERARAWRTRLIQGDEIPRGMNVRQRDRARKESLAKHQTRLRTAVNSGRQATVNYLKDELQLDDDQARGVPALPRSITDAEFRDPCFEVEREIVEAWDNRIAAREAAAPAFWTQCHVSWIEREFIGADPRAALTGTIESGRAPKTMDGATRNFIRRVGGLPEVRGKVSVLNDAPIARAWWRARLAAEAHRHLDGSYSVEEIHLALHASNQVWATLVGLAVRSITVVNHPNVRAAIISTLIGRRRGDGVDNKVAVRELKAASQALARYSTVYSLSSLSVQQLNKIAERGIEGAEHVSDEGIVGIENDESDE